MEDLSDLDIGTYQLTVTDATGVMVTSESVVLGSPEQMAIVGDSLIIVREESCRGRAQSGSVTSSEDGILTVDVVGGTGVYTYLWDDPTHSTNDTLYGARGGVTYSVTITDEHGCDISKSAALPQPPLQDPMSVQLSISPMANSLDATVSLSGLTGLTDQESHVFTYTIDAVQGSAMAMVTDAEASFTVTAPANGTYTFTLLTSEWASPADVCEHHYGDTVTRQFTVDDGVVRCPTTHTVTDPINDGEVHVVRATQSLIISVVISNQSTLRALSAQDADFIEGFEVEQGSILEAQREDCPE